MKGTAVSGIVLALSLISMLLLPFETESVGVGARCATASTPTWTVTDDFSTDSGLWSFVETVVNIDTGASYPGSACRDSVNSYLVLTENGDHQAGVVWLTRDVPLSFTVEFRYKAGGGTGADGLVFMFGKQKEYDPYDGGGMGFVTPPGGSGAATAVPGYGIEFDNWYNGENNDPSGNHIALIKDHVNNHLSCAEDARTEDNQWHSVTISVGSSLVEVYLDGGIVLTWEGTIDRTYGGLGFSASTATANNWHIIDDVTIVADAPFYITADGSIDPSGAPIWTADHVTYTLTGNVYAPIVVERDNIAIDGAEFWVDGAGVDTYGSKGIDLSGRRNVAVRNTQIRDFYYGIYLYRSFDSLIQDNNMTDNLGDGIKISYSSGNSIVGNNITSNSDGIGLVESEDNRICENNASDNTSSGIYLWRSDRNRLVWNEADCNNLGIWLGESASNIICHNNFTDNTQQSSIYSPGCSNIWNDVYPSGGNYWSDYTDRCPEAEELDSSGLWDTPYVIDVDNQDNYPLVNPCVLGRTVANLAEAMIGAEYSWGGAGWNWTKETEMWTGGSFMDPQQIRDGYYHYQDPDGYKKQLPGEVVLRHGVDCSGLVYWAYNKAYVATTYAPEEAWEEVKTGTTTTEFVFPHNPVAFTNAHWQRKYNVQQMDKATLKTDLLPGDLIFFDNTPANGWIDHVAIYVGDYTYAGGTIKSIYYPPGTYDCVESFTPDRGILPCVLETLKTRESFKNLEKPFGRVRPASLPVKDAGGFNIFPKSPVTLRVTDPLGLVVSDNVSEALDMIYLRYDADEDGEVEDVVVVLEPMVGDYIIETIPKPDALPGDTYSLKLSTNSSTVTLVQNISISEIPPYPYIVTANGTAIVPRLDPHDIGITSFTSAKTVIGQNFVLPCSLSIFNYGNSTESFNVTIYANAAIIATFRNISLAPRNSAALNFSWSTAGFDKGNYTMSVGADPVSGETYTADNTFVGGWVVVTSHGWELDFTAPTRYPIVDFAVYSGSLYAAADNKLYVYNGSWNALNAPAFVTSLEPYEDKLIVGGQGGLHYYNETSFGLIFSVPTYIKALGVYDNRLYAGTMLGKPPTLYYCNGSCENPSNWYVDTDFTAILNFSGAFGSIDSFAVYDNVMYVGSGGTLYSFNGTSWSIAASYTDVYAFLDMQVYNGKLYLGTRDQAWRKPIYQGGTGFSGRVIQFDGNNWTTVFDHDYWIYSLETYDGRLYVGTANKIFTFNGTYWETSFHSEEGAYYAISLMTYDGKIYAGMGNGYIFVDPSSETLQSETVAVPEFPSFIILPLFISATLVAVLIKKKKRVT